MALLELNLKHAGLSLGLTVHKPLLLNNSRFQGESKASAGEHFQEHRYNAQPSYIANCINSSMGLHSVSFKQVRTSILGEPCVLSHVEDCSECESTPYLHEGISFIHRDKTLFFSPDNKLFIIDHNLDSTFVEIKGVDPRQLKDVIDIVSIQGKRIVIMTKDEIYYSSLIDGTGAVGGWASDESTIDKPYINFYELAGATGKFSISSSIGVNRRLVATDNLLYMIGTQGGVVSKQCSEDELYPFALSVIKNFDGINHKDHVVVKQDKVSSFMVMSKTGLGLINGDAFTPTFDDIDSELRRDMAVYFNLCLCGDELYVEGCVPCSEVMLETSHITTNVVKTYREEETLTGDTDYDNEDWVEYDDPMFYEQSGSEPSRFKVTTTNRFYVISYNSGVVEEGCEDSCICYSRMYLYDKRLNTGTILHIKHKDVSQINDDFLINSEGVIKRLVHEYDKEMPSFLYFRGLTTGTKKWVQLTEMNLNGLLQKYDEDELFNKPLFSVTTDDSGIHYHDRMSLYHTSENDAQYGDIIRGRSIDFVVPFKGFLVSLFLDYHR